VTAREVTVGLVSARASATPAPSGGGAASPNDANRFGDAHRRGFGLGGVGSVEQTGVGTANEHARAYGRHAECGSRVTRGQVGFRSCTRSSANESVRVRHRGSCPGGVVSAAPTGHELGSMDAWAASAVCECAEQDGSCRLRPVTMAVRFTVRPPARAQVRVESWWNGQCVAR
jgi:hypothetical protein